MWFVVISFKMKFFLFLIYLHILNILTASSVVSRVDITQAPYIEDSHEVQFFILEDSFPYNAPSSIRNMAGEVFQKYYITHAGLGVWDTTKNYKFTIEFICQDYVGALFPLANTTTDSLFWQNKGSVVITTPTDDQDWLNSQLVSVTTGVAYNQLISYMQANMKLFEVYQPIHVVYKNISQVSNIGTVNSTQDNSMDFNVPATESFWFVNLLLGQLSTYGALVGSYLTVYATSCQYVSQYCSATVPVVQVDAAVVAWYAQLFECYSVQYAKTQDKDLGGQYFLKLVQSCYRDHAYVYHGPYTVYNVSLGNNTGEGGSPQLSRYVLNLLADGTGKAEALQTIDYILIALFFLALLAGTVYILRRLCRTAPRRKVSLAGDKVAERAVLQAGGRKAGDGAVADTADRHQAYYRTKSSDGSGVLLSLFSTTLRSTLSSPSSSSPAGMQSQAAVSGRSSPGADLPSPSPSSSCVSKPAVGSAGSADMGNTLRPRTHSLAGHDSGDSRV